MSITIKVARTKTVSIIAITAAILSLVIGSTAAADPIQTNGLAFDERHADEQMAMLKYDIRVELNEDWSYITKKSFMLRFQRQNSKKAGDVPIEYDETCETVTDIKAVAVTEDGVRHPYTSIQDFKTVGDFPMYSGVREKKITFPHQAPGTTIELSYTVKTREMPITRSYSDTDSLDTDIPIKNLYLEYRFPKKLNMRYREFGLTSKPQITEDANTITYAWSVSEYEPKEPKDEFKPYPTPENAEEWFEFSSFKSWEELNRNLMEIYVKYLKVTPEIAQAAQKAAQGKLTVRDKTRSILEYIQSRYRYVSMSFGNHSIIPHATDEVFANEYGDCKDLSLLLIAMLRSVGVNAHLAMMRDEGETWDPSKSLPMTGLFNHALVLVEDSKEGDFYADPLLEGYDIGEYPSTMQAAWTFVLTEDGGRFGRLPIFGEDRLGDQSKREFFISPDGSAVVDTEAVWDLDTSIAKRKEIINMNDEDRKKFYEKLEEIVDSQGETISRKIEGLDKPYGRIRQLTKIKYDQMFAPASGIIVIDMEGFNQEVDFSAKERKRPIFSPVNLLTEVEHVYHIPTGYEIMHLPEDLDLDIGFFHFTRNYKRAEGTVSYKETTRFRRMEVPVSEYPKVKRYMDDLPNKTRQRILLRAI